MRVACRRNFAERHGRSLQGERGQIGHRIGVAERQRRVRIESVVVSDTVVRYVAGWRLRWQRHHNGRNLGRVNERRESLGIHFATCLRCYLSCVLVYLC